MTERAAAFYRVSTRRQDETLAEPEVTAWCASRAYDVRREFRLRLSASKGKQQGALDEILADVRAGVYSVVVCAALDRIERRGVFALQGWLLDLRKAGGRLESTSPGEEWLGDTSDELTWTVRLAMEADRARREAELRSERTRRGHARKDQLGQGRVRLPLGWRYESEVSGSGARVKFTGRIVADEQAQRAVRAAFDAVAAGGTLQDASRAMTHPRTAEQCGAILRNAAYSTGVLAVPEIIEVAPVVSASVQERVISVLDDRRSATRQTRTTTAAEDFAGRICCHEHRAPLHRMYGPARKDGSRVRYYRGKSEACDCGLFRADEADAEVVRAMANDARPEVEVVTTGGDPGALARIEAEMAMVFRKKPDGWVARLAGLEGAAEAVRAGNAVTRASRETGRTTGQAWAAMDRAGQRRYLARQAEQGTYQVTIAKPLRARLAFPVVTDLAGERRITTTIG